MGEEGQSTNGLAAPLHRRRFWCVFPKASQKSPNWSPIHFPHSLFFLLGVTQVVTSGPVFGKTQTKNGHLLSSCYVKHWFTDCSQWSTPQWSWAEIWQTQSNHVSFLCAESHRTTWGVRIGGGGQKETNSAAPPIPTTTKQNFYLFCDWLKNTFQGQSYLYFISAHTA